jgi:NhaA family Na+:H+ antiporter
MADKGNAGGAAHPSLAQHGKRPSLMHRLSVKGHHLIDKLTHVGHDGKIKYENAKIAKHLQDQPGADVIGIISWMQENSVPLIAGVVIAVLIANVSPDSYEYYFGGGIPIVTDCSGYDACAHVDLAHPSDGGAKYDCEHATGNCTYTPANGETDTDKFCAQYGGDSTHSRFLSASADSHADPCADAAHRRLSGGGNVDVFVLLGGCIDFFGHLPTLRFLANDIIICFFFGIAAKEITESLLPGGSLNPPSKAATPLIATLGGVFGPMAVFFTLVPIFYSLNMFDEAHEMALLHNGWGIVTATDIALAWVVAKKAFGDGHPAIDFLLLLAIADDGLGLIIVAVFYGDPENPAQPQWLLLNVLAMGIAYNLRKWYYRKPKGERITQSWTTYVLICGPISWIGLIKAHLHPALALCFIIPFLPGPEQENLETFTKAGETKKDCPEANSRIGDISEEVHEARRKNTAKHPTRNLEIQAGMYSGMVGHNLPKDLLVKGISAETGEVHHHGSCLDLFEHDCKLFVDMSLGFFALCNAGVEVKTFGGMAWSIYLSLLIGKVLGIVGAAKLGEKMGFPLPVGVSTKHLFMVGLIASIGLTVALFVSDAAFEDEGLKGEAKMGALCSAFNGILALGLSQAFDFGEVHDTCPVKKRSMTIASEERSNPKGQELELASSGHTAQVI